MVCSLLFINYDNKAAQTLKTMGVTKVEISIHCFAPRNIIITLTFYSNVCCQFENSVAPDFQKIASASNLFHESASAYTNN